MASCSQLDYDYGYDEERFETTINRNFLCLICFCVLKDPVQCARNEHYFCRACITKFLETSKRCPTCSDELTVESLAKVPRMVRDMLNESNIRCKYANRGCPEIVQLQYLDVHETKCGFTPVACTNQGCGVTVNKHDQIHHESELCEFRKLTTDTENKFEKLEAIMEIKMTNMEKNVAKNMDQSMAHILGNIVTVEQKIASINTNMASLEQKIEKNMADMEVKLKAVDGKLEAVDNEVRGLKRALIEGFNEIKEVLVKTDSMKEQNMRKLNTAASGDQEKGDIIVTGGAWNDSVEVFSWARKVWSKLQPLPEKRWGATSFVYNDNVTVVGGICPNSGSVNNMIRKNIHQNSGLTAPWSDCLVRLPAKLKNHSSVVHNDQLIVTGGENGDLRATSDRIDEVQLVPPYTVKALSRMPEPRQHHSMEIFGNELFIIGGSTSSRWRDNLSSVMLYDITKNQCKLLAPLPYEVSFLATVKWGDNIVVIGGADKRGNALDTVIFYNTSTGICHMLPPMRCKRFGCTAVVIQNNIVVLGGKDGQGHDLKSAEAFNFDRNTWEELPEMSQERWMHTAVVV